MLRYNVVLIFVQQYQMIASGYSVVAELSRKLKYFFFLYKYR